MLKFVTENERIVGLDEVGEEKAVIEFPEVSPGVYNIRTTDVDPSLQGQGIASRLVQAAVEEIHKKGGKVTATCTYAQAWLKKHGA